MPEIGWKITYPIWIEPQLGLLNAPNNLRIYIVDLLFGFYSACIQHKVNNGEVMISIAGNTMKINTDYQEGNTDVTINDWELVDAYKND